MLTSTETGGRRSQIFYKMKELRAVERRSCGVGWLRSAAVFYRYRRRSSNHLCKRFGYLCDKGVAPTSRGGRGAKLACLPKPRRTIAPLFDFREQCVETLASGVFSFGQPELEQTQKTKSVVYTQRRVTLRALVRLVRDRWEHIGEAIEYHWGRQIVAARGVTLLYGLLGTGSQRSAEVLEFIVNVSRILHCLGHFIAQQPAVALPHAIK